jgi:hypothetical protein
MKSLVYAFVAAAVLAAPVASFAQSNQQPVTRAEVKADLVKVEQAGFNPASHSPYYPADIQAAEARVNPQSGSVQAVANTSGYGGNAGGATQSGAIARPMNVDGVHPLYFGR